MYVQTLNFKHLLKITQLLKIWDYTIKIFHFQEFNLILFYLNNQKQLSLYKKINFQENVDSRI